MSNLVKGFEDEVGKVGAWTREVTAKRVAIVAGITILLNLAVSYGWIDVGVSSEVLKWLGALFDALTAIGAVLVVRPGVTPVVDPHDNFGNKLVPEYTLREAYSDASDAANRVYSNLKAGNVDAAISDLQTISQLAGEELTAFKGDVQAVVQPFEEAAKGDSTAPAPVAAGVKAPVTKPTDDGFSTTQPPNPT